jgi:hypothetical protein
MALSRPEQARTVHRVGVEEVDTVYGGGGAGEHLHLEQQNRFRSNQRQGITVTPHYVLAVMRYMLSGIC